MIEARANDELNWQVTVVFATGVERGLSVLEEPSLNSA
jgi:hypothetical protein